MNLFDTIIHQTNRAHVAIALAEIGGESGLKYLEQLAKNNNSRVAMISGEALKTLKSMISS